MHRTLSLLLLAAPVLADVDLPALFGDGMVLQREVELPVWGRAEPGELVRVQLGDDARTATADAEGRWGVTLDPLPAGGPHEMRINGLVIRDVLVGEVWIGAGQSNMVMHAGHCTGWEEEAPRSNRPRIRLFHEDSGPAAQPAWRGAGSWQVATSENAAQWSAVLFYFGRHLEDELDVPIGLIDSSMSGTPIQSWTSREAQFACEALAESVADEDYWYQRFDPAKEKVAFEQRLAKWEAEAEAERAAGREIRRKPPVNETERIQRQGGVGGLFNGKVAPLAPYAVRGVLWYQGEQNVRRVWGRKNDVPQAVLYQHHLEVLVADWRAHWGRPELPFAWVQLPNFGDGRPGADWSTLRDSQRRALAVPHTGMIIAIDQGETANIHPYEKREVARRASLWALGAVYGRPGATCGPLFASHEVAQDKVVVRFTHVDGGLHVDEKGPVRGFELAGADGVWHRAKGFLVGDLVMVHTPDVPAPLHVRYAWGNDPRVTLFDGAGLPASPFTTVDPGR